MLLRLLLTLFISIELASSSSLSASNSLKRVSRRRLTWNMNDVRSDNVYKRDNVYINKYGVPTSVGRRAIVVKGTGLWPKGIIPYDMSKMTSDDQDLILESMQRITNDTGKQVGNHFIPCITFVPKRRKDKTYIIFRYGDPGDCSAHVGYWRKRINVVTLGDGCVYLNIIQHELMHVIGFQHEQSSPDRDKYLKVYIQNIDPDMLDQFYKYSPDEVVDLNIPYDINSIMQYPEDAFQKQGVTGPTMVAIDTKNPIPPYIMDRRLSPLDVLSVQRLYRCPT